MKRRIEIACLSGFRSLESIEEIIHEYVVEEGMLELGEEAERALAPQLLAFARETWQRARADEAAWTERTPLDRIDDALRDLVRQGTPFMKLIGCSQEDDLTDDGAWVDEDDSLQDNGAKWWLWVNVELHDGKLRAKAHIPWPLEMRRADFDVFANEVTRVFAHHGLPMSFSEEAKALQLAPFPFQKRRTTRAPGEAIPAPPPPVAKVCAVCGGKGWVPQTDPSRFPARCACKG